MTQSILRTDGLAIGYRTGSNSKRILKDGISANLCSGELVCLVGPNGAGKSTLLRTLAGLQPALDGHVNFKGVLKKYDSADTGWIDIHKLTPRQLARRISVVLTEPVDGDGLSAYTLTALGRHPYTDWRGRMTPADEAVVTWALQAVGAAGLAGRALATLSDGERQKIFIARALAQEPDLMILDEPTAFLDLPHRIEIMHTLKHLARSIGQAILLSTHDLDQALQNADRLWLLPMQGGLIYGAPEDLILSGDFEAAFSSDLSTTFPTIFDRHSGTFALKNGLSGEITLCGEGLEAEWTARALKREGYKVIFSSTGMTQNIDLSVDVLHTPQKCIWRLHDGQQVKKDFASIYDLISSLRIIHQQ